MTASNTSDFEKVEVSADDRRADLEDAPTRDELLQPEIPATAIADMKTVVDASVSVEEVDGQIISINSSGDDFGQSNLSVMLTPERARRVAEELITTAENMETKE